VHLQHRQQVLADLVLMAALEMGLGLVPSEVLEMELAPEMDRQMRL
jgi:hypothetical protein